ncbi:PDDEXK nuclease domain-containing protein [Nonomuraea sp. NPDC046570]|uniref:PDDEXK nuclease domain-containing protein n=1 Tax=Nonomuraea sp. NPDC046570 TaxID=3155255 RepID=UPI0033F61D69
MTDHSPSQSAAYGELLGAVRGIIDSARSRLTRSANSIVIETYWAIGAQILARQAAEGWGAKVIDQLAVDLRVSHPEVRGISRRSLHYMRALAQEWPQEFVPQLLHKLPWGHIRVLLDSFSDRPTRDFYATRAVQEGWTRAVLEFMIKSRLHEREGAAITNFDTTVPEEHREALKQLVRDPYVLDFLATPPAAERDLRLALVGALTRFLQELGTGFAFMGTEYRLAVGSQEFFIDLLFYQTRLHRYVVFELKVGPFQPEYVGKLNFYVQVVDGEVRDPEVDHPTLGVLLVADKEQVIVEYALTGLTTPLAVSTLGRLPEEVREVLPSHDAIARTVNDTIKRLGPAQRV